MFLISLLKQCSTKTSLKLLQLFIDIIYYTHYPFHGTNVCTGSLQKTDMVASNKLSIKKHSYIFEFPGRTSKN